MSAHVKRAVPSESRSELALCAVLAAAIHLPVLAWGTALMLAEPAAAAQRPGNISIDVDLSSPQPSAALSSAAPPEIKVGEPEPIERPRERPPLLTPEEPSEPEPEPRRKIEIEAPPTPEEVLKPKSTPSTPSVRTGLTGNRAARIGRHHVVHPDDGTGRAPREGVARVRVKVLASGRAAEVELVESSGHRDLDRAALRGLRRARFQPATRNGQPVDSVIVQAVRFRKKEKR